MHSHENLYILHICRIFAVSAVSINYASLLMQMQPTENEARRWCWRKYSNDIIMAIATDSAVFMVLPSQASRSGLFRTLAAGSC